MATKTISLELDAYDKLKRAKRSPRESFSAVVRRARWDDAARTAGEVVARLEALVKERPECLLGDPALDALDDRIGRRGRRPRPDDS